MLSFSKILSDFGSTLWTSFFLILMKPVFHAFLMEIVTTVSSDLDHLIWLYSSSGLFNELLQANRALTLFKLCLLDKLLASLMSILDMGNFIEKFLNLWCEKLLQLCSLLKILNLFLELLDFTLLLWIGLIQLKIWLLQLKFCLLQVFVFHFSFMKILFYLFFRIFKLLICFCQLIDLSLLRLQFNFLLIVLFGQLSVLPFKVWFEFFLLNKFRKLFLI